MQLAKKIIQTELNLENIGQLPIAQKEKLWSLIQQYYPSAEPEDQQCIFFKFAEFVNHNPGGNFTDLPGTENLAPETIHTIIKSAGISCKKLCLVSRRVTEDWISKRYLSLGWVRKYALHNLREPGVMETMRIWPNEMPYSSAHGMSLCSDGLIEGLAQYGSVAYEWNAPIDTRAEIDNTARDIEKMFREFKLINPNLKLRPMLRGEQLLNMFQNTIAYSTQTTQHLHITKGTIDFYPLFKLSSAQPRWSKQLAATIDLVQVGTKADACFIKFIFASLDNEPLLKFLIDFNVAIVEEFNGNNFVDAYIHLFPMATGDYVFIYEPHVRLQRLTNDSFLNPETRQVTLRKPQWVIPEGGEITYFTDARANGLEFLTKFYDDTCKTGVHKFISAYLTQAYAE